MFQTLLSPDEPVPTTIRDTTERGDIDMEQRSGMIMFVAADRFCGDPVDAAESVDPAAHEHGVHGRGRDAELADDLCRSEPSTPSDLHDPFHRRRRCSGRHRPGSAGSIRHPRGTLGPESSCPQRGPRPRFDAMKNESRASCTVIRQQGVM